MESVAELPAQTTAKTSLGIPFTTANAAENARKAVISREARRQAQRALNALTLEPYVKSRLMRVREQLEKIDGMMALETDPQRLDRLASAQARLSAQEFDLSGRPKPGSRRPGREKPSKNSTASGPLDAE